MSLICTRCILDEQTPGLVLDEDGECNYCKLYDELVARYPNDYDGLWKLRQIADKIRADGEGKPFDVVVGVSGGMDSLFMLRITKYLNLRPIAVHYDNTWNSEIAKKNLSVIKDHMGIELVTYRNYEEDLILRAFADAKVPDIGAPYDIAVTSVLYRTAVKHNIKYIFEGHNFRTEGVSPLGYLYMDGKYIQDVVDRFSGHPTKLLTFPNMTLFQMLYWTAIKRIKKIRPLYYLNASKAAVKDILSSNYDWASYTESHHENIFAAFYHTIFCPAHGFDQRAVFLSAQVRSGYISREDALVRLSHPAQMPPTDLQELQKRLGPFCYRILTEEPKTRTYRDFKSYKRTFERLRPLFWILAKLELVPWSFYHKYTSKKEI